MSLRYALGEQNSKFQVTDFYHVGQNCENSNLPFQKCGINNSSSIRPFQSFHSGEISREYGNNLKKNDENDENENLEDTQSLLEGNSKRLEINSKLRSEIISQESSKFADDILKMKHVADDKMIEETNYIVKLEKMSPDTGVKDAGKVSSQTEKKKTGKCVG